MSCNYLENIETLPKYLEYEVTCPEIPNNYIISDLHVLYRGREREKKTVDLNPYLPTILINGLSLTRGTFLLYTKRKKLDRSKVKTFQGDKLNLDEKLKFVLGRVENIVGKGENAGYQHFLLLPQSFQNASILGLLKVRIVW